MRVDAVRQAEEGGSMWQELFAQTYRYLRRRGLSHADAEDLAQDVLIAAYQHLDGVETGSLQAWVRAVARNKHADWVRKHARVIVVADVPDAPISPDMQHAPADGGLGELHTLSDGDRRLLKLRYVEDKTVEQVAAALGASVNTVKVGLYRARKRARAELEEGGTK